jgi:hypothetical protein
MAIPKAGSTAHLPFRFLTAIRSKSEIFMLSSFPAADDQKGRKPCNNDDAD